MTRRTIRVPRRTAPSAAATSNEFRQNCVMAGVIPPTATALSDLRHSEKGRDCRIAEAAIRLRVAAIEKSVRQGWLLAGAVFGFANQNSNPQRHASGAVSCRLSRKLATMPERMIEAGQANKPQNHPVMACEVGATGQGITMPGPANAVSVGNHPEGIPHGIGPGTARA